MSDDDEDYGPTLPPSVAQPAALHKKPSATEFVSETATSQKRQREENDNEGSADAISSSSAPEADASSSAERQQQKKKLQEDELKALVQALPGTQRYERSFGHDGLIHDICVAETHDGATIITVDSHGTMRWFKKIPRGVFFLQQSKPLQQRPSGGEDDFNSMLVTPNHFQFAATSAGSVVWLVESAHGIVFSVNTSLMMVESRISLQIPPSDVVDASGHVLLKRCLSLAVASRPLLLLVAYLSNKLLCWCGADNGECFTVNTALAHPLLAIAQHPVRRQVCVTMDEKGIIEYVCLRDVTGSVADGTCWLWDSLAQLRKKQTKHKKKREELREDHRFRKKTKDTEESGDLPDPPPSSALFHLFKERLAPTSLQFDASGSRFFVTAQYPADELSKSGETLLLVFGFEHCNLLSSHRVAGLDNFGPSPMFTTILRSPASSLLEHLLSSGRWSIFPSVSQGALDFIVVGPEGETFDKPQLLFRAAEVGGHDNISVASGRSLRAVLCDVRVPRTQALKNLIGSSQLGSLLKPESLFKMFAVGTMAAHEAANEADPALFVASGNQLCVFSKCASISAADGDGGGRGRDLDCSLVVAHAESRRMVDALGAPQPRAEAAATHPGAPAAATGPSPRYAVEIESYSSPVVLELWPAQAPLATRNFESLAGRGFYDGLTFHRTIKGFMIQGGCPKGDGTGGVSAFPESPTFADENLSFEMSASSQDMLLCMANCGKDTNGSQFFITVAPTPWLRGKHTVFGKVTEGHETVRAVSVVPTSPTTDSPTRPVKILRIRRV